MLNKKHYTASLARVKIPFGLNPTNGRLFSASESWIKKGIACGLVCPSCKKALSARKGGKNQHHFAHNDNTVCTGAYESAIHQTAKQVIKDHLGILSPNFSRLLTKKIVNGNTITRFIEHPKKKIYFTTVDLEITTHGYIPDARGLTFNDTDIYIEIYVTHAVSDDKRAAFSKMNMIEVDLSSLDRNTVSDMDSFKKIVLESAPRQWISCQIYNEEVEQKRKELEKEAKATYLKNIARKKDLNKPEFGIVKSAKLESLYSKTYQINDVDDRLSEQACIAIEQAKMYMRP